MIRALLIALVLAGCRENGPCAVTPSNIDFGEVEIDFGEVNFSSAGKSQAVSLQNPSARDLLWTFVPPEPPFFLEAFDDVLFVPRHSGRNIKVRFLPQDGLLHHSDLRLKANDESCDFTVQLTGLGAGRLRAEPQALEFTLSPGQTETKELRIENTRRVPVPLSVSWTERRQLTASPVSAEVPARGSLSLMVTAHPTDWLPTTSLLELTGGGQRLSSFVLIRPSSPVMEVAPLTFEVPVIGVGQFIERTFRVTNTGRSGDPAAPPLVVGASSFTVTRGEAAEMTFDPRQSARLAEGESFDFTVTVLATARAGPRFFKFSVRPNQEFLASIALTLQTTVAELPPCGLEIMPLSELQLQEVADGGVEGTVSFRNFAATSCIVDNLRVVSDTHTITSGAGAQIEVPPRSTHQVTIAGPKAPDAGSVGELRFHVMDVGRTDQSIELRSP